MKKIFSGLLCLTLILTFFVSCGKENKQGENSNTILDNETETVTSTDVDISNMDLEFTDNDLSVEYNATTEEKDDTVKITKAGDYIISGEHKQIIVDAGENDKLKIVLKDATISSDNGPAIYINQADKVFITVPEGTVSTLSDSTEYDADLENADGVIFSRADMTINGSGSLNINSNYKCGIVSKDDLTVCDTEITVNSIGTAIEGKDCVKLSNAKLNIKSSADGIKSNNSEEQDRGYVYINSGSFDITSQNDALQAETALIIESGSFNIVCGGGSAVSSSNSNSGWGNWRGGFGRPDESNTTETDTTDSAKALKATTLIKISGGEFNIDSSDDAIHSNSDLEISGGSFTITSGDDGIHSDDNLIISGGDITINKSYEGIEATVITVLNGNITVTASDDGFNAAGGNDSSSMGDRPGQNPFESDSSASVTINGGEILVNASGDGLDSNGNLTVNGGNIIVNGPVNDGNGALDYGGIATINGGTAIILGSSGMAQTFDSSSKQASVMCNLSSNYSAGTEISISNGNKVLVSYVSEKSFNSIVISAPELEVGTKYTLKIGDDTEDITLSSISTTFGNSGMGGGMGNMGGGSNRPGGMDKPR